MWFNSKTHANLTISCIHIKQKRIYVQVLHGCFQFVIMNCKIKFNNERNSNIEKKILYKKKKKRE